MQARPTPYSSRNSRRQGLIRPKQAQRDPHFVPLDQVKERVLLELSAAFAQQLRAQRSDLKELSFFCEESAKSRRIELSKLIGRLKGSWKISDNASTTNFIIVDQNIFAGRYQKIPVWSTQILQRIYSQAEEYVAKGEQYLKHQSQNSIQESSESAVQLAQPAYRTSFPQNFTAKSASARAQPRKGVHINVLQSWLPSADQVSKFGRQILASDLTQALRFLESQKASFHTSRMKMLLLERDQKKPTTYSDDGAFLAISRLNLGGPDEKHSSVQQQIRDITNRQFFHEFDKLPNQVPLGQGHGGSATAAGMGQSPAKSLMQVAMAQEKFHAAKNCKASPVGFLSKQVDTERQENAEKRQRQQYNIHRLDMKTPNGYCPCVNKTEKQFAMQFFERIERTRERENYKNLQKAIEANNDVQDWHNMTLLEPIPNEQHTYCQVCMEKYDDYLDHIQNSATHKSRAKIQEQPFAEIDIIIDELNRKQKWINNWHAEPIVEHPMMSLNGFSQYSQLYSQNNNESVSPCYYASSQVYRRKRQIKPPTPFKLQPPQSKVKQDLPPANAAEQTTNRIPNSTVSVSAAAADATEEHIGGRSLSQSLAWPKGTEMIDSDPGPESHVSSALPLLAQHQITPEKDSRLADPQRCEIFSPHGQERSSSLAVIQAKEAIDSTIQRNEDSKPSCTVKEVGSTLFRQQSQNLDVQSVPQQQDEHLNENDEEDEYEDDYSDSEDESETNSCKQLLRDSLHITHFHSLNKPLQDQTHFKRSLEADDSELEKRESGTGSIEEEEGESSPLYEDKHPAESEDDEDRKQENESDKNGSSETIEKNLTEDVDGVEDSMSDDEDDETMGLAALGNEIARIDRRIKGDPTPDKTTDTPLSSTKQNDKKEGKKDGDDIDVEIDSIETEKELYMKDSIKAQDSKKTTNEIKKQPSAKKKINFQVNTENFGKQFFQQPMPASASTKNEVRKVLDFDCTSNKSHDEDNSKQPGNELQELENQLKTSPQLSLPNKTKCHEESAAAKQSKTKSQVTNDSQVNMFQSATMTPAMKVPQPSPEFSATVQSSKTDTIMQKDISQQNSAFITLLKTFDQIKTSNEEKPAEEEIQLKPNPQARKPPEKLNTVEDHIQDITVDLSPYREHSKVKDAGDTNHAKSFQFVTMSRDYRNDDHQIQQYESASAGGKRSVPSLLTSNDKYSIQERRSSVTSEKNETCKFGTVGSSISAYPENHHPIDLVIKVEKEEAHALTTGINEGTDRSECQSEAANQGTFGNVSFGCEGTEHIAAISQKEPESTLLEESPFQASQKQQKQGPTQSAKRKKSKKQTKKREEESIVTLLDPQSKKQQHQHSSTIFASQAQLQSQHTLYAGEFSSSQNLIPQTGATQFSSFNTQKSALLEQHPQQQNTSNYFAQYPVSSGYPVSSAGSSVRGVQEGPFSDRFIQIEQTLNITMSSGALAQQKASSQVSRLTDRSQTPVRPSVPKTTTSLPTGEPQKQKKVQATKCNRQKLENIQALAQKPVPDTLKKPNRNTRFYMASSRQSTLNVPKVSGQSRRTQAITASSLSANAETGNASVVRRSQQLSNATFHKKRTYAEAFPESIESFDKGESKPMFTNLSKANVDLPMHQKPRSITKRLRMANPYHPQFEQNVQKKFVQAVDEASVEMLFGQKIARHKRSEK